MLQRLFLHPPFDLAAFPVQLVETPGPLAGERRSRREQALDAERHVLEATGRVEARRERESDIRRWVARAGSRPATRRRASIPGRQRPALIRASP